MPTLPSPVHFESLSMPFDDGFRFDDEERILPAGKEVSHHAKEHPIETLHFEFGRGTHRYFKLLSEKEDFELELGSCSEVCKPEGEEGADHLSL